MGVPISLPLARKHPDALGEKHCLLRPPSRVQGAQPPPGVQRVPRNAERKPHLSLKGGCREPLVPAGGNRGCPPVSKNIGGWAGGTTAHAKPDPPPKEGAGQNKTIRPHQRADAGVRGPCHIPIAKYEQLCYSGPMKRAAIPLLFLGACRIHEHCANHGESPCGRGAEGTTQGARPSEEGWGPEPMPLYGTGSLEPSR